MDKPLDIRSFFSPSSGGGGGANKTTAKAKAPTPSSGKSAKAEGNTGKGNTPSKTSSSAKRGKGAGNSSPNAGVSRMTMDSKSKDKSPAKRGENASDEDDDDDDAVEVIPSPSKSKAAATASATPTSVRKKSRAVPAYSDDEDDDVVQVATIKGRRTPTRSSPRKPSKSTRESGDAPSKGAGGRSPKKASPASAAGRRNGAGRRAVKAVNYKEDGDDDGDDDDGDNFSDEDVDEGDVESDDEGHDDDDDDDNSDDEDARPSSRKRKSTSSVSKGPKKRAVLSAASSTPKKGRKRVVVDDSEDDEELETTPSRQISSPSSSRSKSKVIDGKSAKAPNAKPKKTEDIIELGGTSSDEAAEEEEEEKEKKHTPPPRKTKPTPTAATSARAKSSPSAGSDTGGAESSGKKKAAGGGGGGGFRPAWMGGGRKAPPNEGKKDVPVGAESCLAGKTFVVSGVLDSLGREAAEDLIKEYGGKVTTSVSSKTTYLMLGSVLDDGRPPTDGSKYKKAQQHKTKIIDEDGLFKMLTDSNPSGKSPSESGAKEEKEGATSAASEGTAKPAVANPYAAKKPAVVNPYGSFASKKPAGEKAGGAAVVNPYGAAAASKATSGGKPQAKASSSSGGGGSAPSNEPGQMWVDKYKPRVSTEVIGHASQVKKLKFWLQNWERWHLDASGGAKPPTGKDNPGARAALLSGVPGVGKSSSATLVAKEMGYHVMELNASDTRNKSSLSVELASVLGNQVLSFKPVDEKNAKGKGGGSKSGGFRKQLVVMDEVDGMGGSDRGGIQELIMLIKKSKVPIIAICNDRQHQKIRSLVNHCYDLRFSRPQKATIAKRVKAIAKMEGMDVDDNAAEMLVEANGNDVRQVLHALQMWSRKSSKMTYMNLKGGLSSIEKDKVQRIGPFDAARTILGGAARTSFRDRFEAFFTDYSLLPLLIHQNYLSSLMQVEAKTRTDVTASASAAVSDADIISGKMRGDVQHWELLPAQAALNVRVGSIGGGSLGFPEFPKWLGNYSRENKRRRLLGELSTHLNASISGGTEAVRLSYMHFLRTMLTKPLVDEGADGARACVELLEEYGLSRDDLFEVLPEFQLSTKGMKLPPRDVFASLDTKTKTAVTRCYNSLTHKSQALVETMQAPKKSKKRKAPPKSLDMAEDEAGDNSEGGEEEEEEEEEEDSDVSAFKKKGRGRASPAGGKGKAKAAAKPRSKKAKK